jgi:nucleoside-diphosphate-sugar epimerase|tara:strand:+ start:3089 stop:3745 length:657 start_codon:yes stop_codon:yes gene_type:complete
MKILITCSTSVTGKKLLESLSQDFETTSTDVSDSNSDEFSVCQLDHDQQTDNLVEGVDLIVNVGYGGQSGDDRKLIDYHTRCIYNLLTAASNAGVKRVINLSTLKLYESLTENLAVTENWATQPNPNDVNVLCAHLCEMVVKEFARDNKFQVTNLRLGFNIGDKECSSTITDNDFIHAVKSSINANPNVPWEVIHVQSKVPNQRFITRYSQSVLGVPE